MTIHDPRLGEDFVLRDSRLRTSFSSLRSGLYVMDLLDRGLLSELAKLVKRCIPRTSNIGFFTLGPWSPGAKAVRDRIRQEFPAISEFEGSVAGYFDPQNIQSLDMLLDIRSAFGGNKTGEWGFGGCTERFPEPKRSSFASGEWWDFAHILGSPENIGSFLYLGDGYTTFMSKIFHGFDTVLAESSICLPKADRGRA
jgi:hypothetical protein